VDLHDLEAQRPLIEAHGKLFTIDDDTSAEQITAWIEDNYL
jgi:hypothetical protein